ncbi:hypothetical protein P12x_004324 [Tundrisphaera lichenicola]|uniref:hypothetical protein n=1 Tax=Tundrisphaera lichenicola TaxID=2029860 RepID=UPI003EBAE2AF
MSIGSSPIAGHPARGWSARPLWVATLVSIAVASVLAQQFRPAPKFEGKAIPEPPEQGRPWTAPETTLPKFLLTATADLFDQGMPDPRGCEYRDVEIGNFTITRARGFVLPERSDVPGRFVVCWDGLLYPALTIGEPADLDRDIRDLADSLRQAKEAAKTDRFARGAYWGFRGKGQDYTGIAGVQNTSPIKLCLLLRLGRADLAESLFAAGTPWTPGPRARDLTNYGISYLTLATDWAGSAFGRMVEAHARGVDVIALDTARRLAKFRVLATARFDALGFPRPDPQGRFGLDPAGRFPFLGQLDDLLGDQERRARMPARGPIPGKGGDPTARVAALIRDLDQIDEQQMMSPGSAHPGSSPLVKDLIAEGDPAVEPLLTVLESDDRLTRSVSNGRGMMIDRFVHPVHEAAFAALIGILKTQEFDDRRSFGWQKADPAARKSLASSIRQFWEKTRSIPLAERWYRTLLDDSAVSARWLEAAGGIVSMEVEAGVPYPKPGTRPMRGEPLRDGRDPSVTALMLRRSDQIRRTGNPQTSHDPGFNGACQMGSFLAAWDEKASLPLLKALSRECRTRSDRWRGEQNQQNPDQNLASSLARFTQIRVKQGDLEALDEYASWLRTTTPKMLEYGTFEALKPLLDRPDHPSLASAAVWLFNDPKSPWVPLLPEARGELSPHFQNLFASPLIVVSGFRRGVIAALADRTPLGTLERSANGTIQRKIKGVPTMSYGSNNLDLEGVAIGREYPFRACDDLASQVSGLEGSPPCELFWPEARRDEAVAACVGYLTRYGANFTTESPPGVHDFPTPKTHLMFPNLGRPATPEDVASARAIFSLEGQGETRLINLSGLPQKARWVILKDTPIDLTSQDGVTRREYDSDGYVWQAEEVRQGDVWERYYGFVGHHIIARAPASEVEFTNLFGPWWVLKGGLQARLELVEPRAAGFEPGQSIRVALHLQNRLGVTRSSPTEFARAAPDGKPALRKGANLSLWRSTGRGSRSDFNQSQANDPVEPIRDVHFDPGDGSRSLEPLESFEAMRLDLNDWFNLSKPGRYRLRATFEADSGVGEGSASEVYFQVLSDE